MNALGKILLLGASAVTPLTAQLRVETGGGQGQLDQLAASSLASLDGDLNARIGPSRLLIAGDAEDRAGLGSTDRASASWLYRITAANWTIDAGPEAELARDIAAPWAHTVSAHLALARILGPFVLMGEWQQGTAQAGPHANAWHRPTVGIEFRAGQFSLGASWHSTITDDTADTYADSLSPSHNSRNIHDISTRAAWAVGPLLLSAQVGRRFGLALQPEIWWDTQGAFRLTEEISLTARTGRLASDELLNLRGAKYTTVGVQLDVLHTTRRSDPPVASNAAVVTRDGTGLVHVCFDLPAHTRRARFNSDLTAWRPVPMARLGDGRWQAVVDAKAGVYRVDISVDDGPWQAPAGLPAADDGFGHQVSLLVVPE